MKEELADAIQIGWPKVIGNPQHRRSKPEENWSTQDLATEFAAVAYQEGHAKPGTIPGREIAMIVNKLVREGFTRYQILGLIRKFFAQGCRPGYPHPRSLWASFMGYAYRWKDTVDREPHESIAHMTEQDLAHQAKMLELLKNN